MIVPNLSGLAGVLMLRSTPYWTEAEHKWINELCGFEENECASNSQQQQHSKLTRKPTIFFLKPAHRVKRLNEKETINPKNSIFEMKW